LCFVKSWRTAIFVWAVTCSISLFRYDYFGAEGVSASLKEYGILFFLSHLPFFMVGVACFFAMRDLNYGRSTNPWGPTLRGITLVSCFVLSMIYFSKQWSNSVAEEIFISFISYFLIMNSISKLPVWIDNGATRYLGKISYSVYLTQFPVITILYSSGAFSNIASHTSSTSIAYALAALLTVSLVISVSSVTYKYIEAPLIRLGKRSYRPLPSRPEAT
jgi:peptidoglycan/LPS O-acetylase OafA/YrhL